MPGLAAYEAGGLEIVEVSPLRLTHRLKPLSTRQRSNLKTCKRRALVSLGLFYPSGLARGQGVIAGDVDRIDLGRCIADKNNQDKKKIGHKRISFLITPAPVDEYSISYLLA